MGFFFFQAEDGIRDLIVTGVQTCALPIFSAEGAKAKQFDAVVIPGGFAPDYMRRSEAMVRFVKDASDEGKVVAAICHAGSMLVSARVLKGRTVTCFKSIKDDVVNAGGNYVDREVVR